jgi:hypothetical protein
MATTVNLRKILDRKQWEMTNNLPATTVTGSCAIQSEGPDQNVMYVTSAATAYLYDPTEDAYVTLPSPSLAGTFGIGVCGAYHINGPTGTASAGTSTTLTSTVTTMGSLAGYTIRITGGTGRGQERVITSNTVGSNAVFTVPTWTTTPDATSTYLLLTGRYYVFVPHATATSQGFKYYDVATNAWSSALAVTNAPSGAAADLAMRATCGSLASMATGTATSATSTTLVNSAKTWTTSQWTNFQVRITAGTGAGQIRTISGNDATSLLVPAWTTTPDATSVYSIEGNDDFIYLTGNGATTFYKYTISTNTWSTLAARLVAPGSAPSLNWVRSSTNATWTSESAIINGRRLYTFRGGATGNLDYYDIPTNAWVSVSTAYQYGGTETFTTGTAYENGSNGLIYIQKDATGRFFKFDCMANALMPWSLNPFTQGTAITGNRMFSIKYVDGATTITYIYWFTNSLTLAFRCMVI